MLLDKCHDLVRSDPTNGDIVVKRHPYDGSHGNTTLRQGPRYSHVQFLYVGSNNRDAGVSVPNENAANGFIRADDGRTAGLLKFLHKALLT